LFAWSVLAGVGQLMLLVLCIPIVGLALTASFTRLCARLAVAIAGLVEMLLGVVHAVGVLVVRLLRWAGVPVPPAETMAPQAYRGQTAPSSLALAHTGGGLTGETPSVLAPPGANGTGHLALN
jgi:hypothetical protein